MATEQTNQLPLEQTKPAPTDISVKAPEQPKAETQSTSVAKVKEVFTPQLCSATISKIKNDPELAPLHGIANAFAKPFESFRKAFKDPNEADRIMAKEIDFAAQAMMANTYLITVATQNPISLVNAIKNIALAETTLNPVLKQAYLVPFTIKSKPTIVLFPSYMGEISMMTNTGLVKKIEAHCVYKGDEFKISHGSKEELTHIPDCWADRSEDTLLGAYYFAILTDGTEMFDFMNKAEIDKIKGRSPSTGIGKDGKPKQSPWTSDYTEMARKTLVHRAFKAMPKDGISENKLKVLEAVFDYDEKAEQTWISEQKVKTAAARSRFDEEEVEYEEIKN